MRSGLGIVEAIGQLNGRIQDGRDIDLHVRIGIDTGLVVAGAVGPDEGMEAWRPSALPNVAARLQGLAAPDSVVISAAAYGLIAAISTAGSSASSPFVAFPSLMAIYQVLHESGARTRLDVAAQRDFPDARSRHGARRSG